MANTEKSKSYFIEGNNLRKRGDTGYFIGHYMRNFDTKDQSG